MVCGKRGDKSFYLSMKAHLTDAFHASFGIEELLIVA